MTTTKITKNQKNLMELKTKLQEIIRVKNSKTAKLNLAELDEISSIITEDLNLQIVSPSIFENIYNNSLDASIEYIGNIIKLALVSNEDTKPYWIISQPVLEL